MVQSESKKIHKDTPNSIILDQFENQANPEIHYKTTAQEIWSSVDGQLTLFWSGNRRNNYRSGNFFKGKKKDIKVIAVEPEDSAV